MKLEFIFLFIKTAISGDGCREGRHCVCYAEKGIDECYSENSPWGGTLHRPLRTLPLTPGKINPIARIETVYQLQFYSKIFLILKS